MAEVEFGGLKFTGGKMFVLLTALSTLGGAAWGGFEFYNDYRNMKEQIQEYVAPDLSAITEELAVTREELESTRAIVESFQSQIKTIRDSVAA